MQYVDRIGELGYIHNAKRTAGIANPDLSNARLNRIHRFPVVGIEALLHLEDLPACLPSRLIWKAQ